MPGTHGGPLFGEGANYFYWAGRCDGVEAQVAGGEDHTAFLDFDLLKLHPQMVNHGMGYYERWFRRGYDAQWGVDADSVEQLDKYRAMELAYGHAGFLGARLIEPCGRHMVRRVLAVLGVTARVARAPRPPRAGGPNAEGNRHPGLLSDPGVR